MAIATIYSSESFCPRMFDFKFYICHKTVRREQFYHFLKLETKRLLNTGGVISNQCQLSHQDVRAFALSLYKRKAHLYLNRFV